MYRDNCSCLGLLSETIGSREIVICLYFLKADGYDGSQYRGGSSQVKFKPVEDNIQCPCVHICMGMFALGALNLHDPDVL